MNIHEYQGKSILKAYGLTVPNGFVAHSVDELLPAGRKIETDRAVVKAQIHAGGRGKAGGVKLVDSLDGVVNEGSRLLGSTLVTHQTGPEGKRVNRVYIEETCPIDRELYLSMIVDRQSGQVAIVSSKEGGMDIEEVAQESPQAILTTRINPALGIRDYQLRQIQACLDLDKSYKKPLSDLLKGMYTCFCDLDCEMIEINPLVVSGEKLVALDAKMAFDDNGLYRHEEVLALKDESEESPKEIEAGKYDLSYVSLDGDIGCLVNGAGLAMATMDAVFMAGGQPANFLDVGGSATADQVKQAILITLSDQVKGLFINIFGGIMHCDTVARGLIAAMDQAGANLPVVIRLKGTNSQEGRAILSKATFPLEFVETISQGAEKIVEMVGGKNEHLDR